MKKSKISTLSVSLTCDQLFSLSFYGLIRIFKLIMRVFSLSILRVKTLFFKVIFATNMARLDQGITLNQNTTLRANGNINQMMLLRKSTGLNYEKIIRSVFAFWSSSNLKRTTCTIPKWYFRKERKINYTVVLWMIFQSLL